MNNILKTTSAIILSTVMMTGVASARTIKPLKAQKVPAPVNYKINAQLSIPELKLSKNTFIADYKYIDVNGDKVKDNVVLAGVKENKSTYFSKDLNIIVQDGKTKKFIKTAIGKDCSGYQPKMFLGDFNKDKVPDVFVSMPTGGSGGISEYALVSFKGNTPKPLVDYKKFNAGIDLAVKFLPNYKAELNINSLKKKEVLDLTNKKSSYIEQGVYDDKGNIKESVDGWMDGYGELKPVDADKDGNYELKGVQRICGSCHADSIAHLVTEWKWDGNKIKLDTLEMDQTLDTKIGDVNGNGSKDVVTLLGTKEFNGESFYVRDIKVQVYDEKDGTVDEFSVKNNNEGYEPTLFLGDFNKDKSEDMLISVPSGGSGGISTYSLISYKGNKAVDLFDSEKFNLGIDCDANFKENFKADVLVKAVNKTFTLDISDNKDMYIETKTYNKNGKLLEGTCGMMNPLSELKAVDLDKDGSYELEAVQRICGIANADTLGYVKSTWKIENSKVNLVDVTVTK